MRAEEIAKQVSSGEISAKSVLEQHFETINTLEPQVNAFNIVTIEEALKEADEIDSKIASGEKL